MSDADLQARFVARGYSPTFSVATAPPGGSTVDTEARAAIDDLIEVLEGRGLL